jgi:hypothetical protein
MWELLLDVGGSEDCERPKIVAEVGINEHGMSHAANS